MINGIIRQRILSFLSLLLNCYRNRQKNSQSVYKYRYCLPVCVCASEADVLHSQAVKLGTWVTKGISSRIKKFNPVLSPNNGVGLIFLILLEIVLTHNLQLDRLLSSLAFNHNFLLWSTTAFCEVFLGLPHFLVHFKLKSNAKIRQLFEYFFQYMSMSTDTISSCEHIYCFIQVKHLHYIICRHLYH